MVWEKLPGVKATLDLSCETLLSDQNPSQESREAGTRFEILIH